MVSGLTTQKRWWEQRAVGRESQEHPKASELSLDLAEYQGSAGARGSRERHSHTVLALVSGSSEMLKWLSPRYPGVGWR